MALEVFFRSDIANIIRSVNQAGGNTGALIRSEIENCTGPGVPVEMADLERSLDLYEQGYRDALGAIAVAFGILPKGGK